MNAKYIKDKKYTANGEVLKNIREQLGLPLNKMGDFFKEHKVKKVGSKSYVEMERERRQFSRDRFEDVAIAFSKEFTKRGDLTSVWVEELFKQEEQHKQKSIFLNQIYSGQDLIKILDKVDRKKVLNLSSVKRDQRVYVKHLFDSIKKFLEGSTRVDANENYDSDTKESLHNFSSEEAAMDTLITFDACVDNIVNSKLNLYCGILPAFIADLYINGEQCFDEYDPSNYLEEYNRFEQPEKIHKSKIKKIEMKPEEIKYMILYFSDKEFETVKLTHKTFLTHEEKNKIISNKNWVLNDLKFLPETNTVDTLKALVVSKLLEQVGYLVPSFLHSHELEISTTRKFDPILDYPGGLEEKD